MEQTNRTASLEQEVKFFLESPALIRKRLIEIGMEPCQARLHETNIRFDASDGRLTRQGKVLRLREASKTILTYKQPEEARDATPPSPARRHLETEIIVEDLEKTAHLLEGLGFRPIVRYEKYREVFRRKSTLAMFDQLPYGDFLELEGPDLAELRRTSEQLGLEWESALQASYMGIFLTLKKTYRLNFLESSFANFTGWERVKTAAVLSRLPHEVLHDRQTL
jgi:adenylate cyclase class 2